MRHPVHTPRAARLARALAVSLGSAALAAVLAHPALAQRVDQRRDTLVTPAAVTRLTRAEAIRLALANNPTIQIAREQVAQSRARLRNATALPEPTAGLSVLGQPGVLHPHSGSETDLGLGITIPFPNKYRLLAQAARGDVGTFEAGYTLQRQAIVLQTNQAYDSLLVSLQHRRDLQEARKLTQDFFDRTQARFNAGTVPKLDVIKAQVTVAQAENDLIANERGVANARAALNRLTGRVLGAPVDAADSLVVPETVPDMDRLLALAMANRGELRSIEAARAGARASERLAQQYFLPDVGISVSRNNVYGQPLAYATGVSLTIPLPWQHQRGAVAEARSRQRELEAQYRDVLAQVQQDLGNAYANASTALRQAVYLRDELLPAARDAYRAASASYSLGGSSSLEVIDAQRTLLDAQTQYAAALAAANDAVADLERAAGAPLSSASNVPQGSAR
jgi:outer membrane protein, heavy metal efflux system